MSLAHALDDMTIFREYEPREIGRDGYPLAWHDLGRGEPLVWTEGGEAVDCWDEGARGPFGVKHLVRAVAGTRCQRCGHPYIVGGTYSEASSEREAFALYPQGGGAEAMRLWSVDEPPMAMVGKDRPVNWSPCDISCAHFGPYRWRLGDGYPWTYVDEGDEPGRIIADGIAKGAVIQAAWRILTVHHLNERKHDLRWHNLAALCQRCHLFIQRKVTMETPWPWEHTDWFKPHAAAWYALRYRGENLTYTQTLARLDELLALGREHEAVERMAL